MKNVVKSFKYSRSLLMTPYPFKAFIMIVPYLHLIEYSMVRRKTHRIFTIYTPQQIIDLFANMQATDIAGNMMMLCTKRRTGKQDNA